MSILSKPGRSWGGGWESKGKHQDSTLALLCASCHPACSDLHMGLLRAVWGGRHSWRKGTQSNKGPVAGKGQIAGMTHWTLEPCGSNGSLPAMAAPNKRKCKQALREEARQWLPVSSLPTTTTAPENTEQESSQSCVALMEPILGSWLTTSQLHSS